MSLTTGTYNEPNVELTAGSEENDLSWVNYFRVQGKDMFKRTHIMKEPVDKQKQSQLWLYFKSTMTAPKNECKGHDLYGNVFEGPSFASQDYLGLSSDPGLIEEVTRVTKEYGVHSGGSPLAFGSSKYYNQLQKELADFWGYPKSTNIILYPTGWMSGFGVIKGLVRDYDHIVMDKLAHNCLQEGARASTENIHYTKHLDVKEMEDEIRTIRTNEPDVGIFVITESLFSMDSDSPNLVEIQKVCKKYDAFLLIDCAHDTGVIGEKGLGFMEVQGLKDRSNVILLGAGSKVLCTNVGWVGCHDEDVIEYLRYFSSPYMFSNAISPIQAAGALYNLRLVRSPTGLALRKKVMDNILYLRKKLNSLGYKVTGNPSPIVPLLVGGEIKCRLVARIMLNRGVIVNGIEFPVVPKGGARLRLQVMASHTKENLDKLIDIFDSTIKYVETKMELAKSGPNPTVISANSLKPNL